ncbi:MAG: hypothetical protein FWH41_00705, partial [Treponema sp.]|nr:hypothetical protein [Treponema sp.]
RGLNGQGNWSKWWDFILQPGSVSINNNNLSQTVAVVGWPTGAVTLNNTSALPTGVSVGVAGTTITVTGVRPQLGSDPITGDFTIGVTFGGVTKNLSISVHLTDDPIFVSIGTGNTSTREMPFNFYDRQSWVQTMYYKDEIGQPSGSEIIEISYFNSFASTITRRVRVYMANTSNTNVNSWLAASNFTSTLVFDGEIRFPTGQNEISIELDTPFVYNGGNLVILTHRLYTTYTTGENFIQTTGSVANRSRYYSDDGPSTDSVIVPSDPGTGSDAFPNIRLKIVVNN